MKALGITGTELRRLTRRRANLFFLLVLPMLIILLLGAAFGGSQQARIGVIGGERGQARALVATLRSRPAVDVHLYTSRSSLEHAVAAGDLDAGLLVPANFNARLATGDSVTVTYFGRPNSVAQQLRMMVQSIAADESRSYAAARAIRHASGVPFATALSRARSAAATAPTVDIRTTAADGSAYTSAEGRFDTGASTQLLLFVFLTSLTGAVALIETRRLGIARRMLSTPTSTATLVVGLLLGRLTIALVQALIIVLGSMLAFGVNWGDPLGTAAVILAFSLVGTGAALLIGSLFVSEQQAGPVAMLLGLGLAALGGSMAPLEVFPSTARAIAHITPHAWANDAFSKLLRHGGDLPAVLPQIGVLLAFAAAAITLAIWRLRRTLATA